MNKPENAIQPSTPIIRRLNKKTEEALNQLDGQCGLILGKISELYTENEPDKEPQCFSDLAIMTETCALIAMENNAERLIDLSKRFNRILDHLHKIV